MTTALGYFSMIFADGEFGVSRDAMLVLTGAGTVIALLFKLLIAAKDEKLLLIVAERDRVITDLVAEKSKMAEFNKEALRFALEMINEARGRDGEGPLIVAPSPLPAAIPPHMKQQLEHSELEMQLKTLSIMKENASLRAAQKNGHGPEAAAAEK